MITPDSSPNQRSILFCGAFPPSASGTRAISEDVALRLGELGWHTRVVSRRSGRLARVLDVLATAWCTPAQAGVANLDVYSGAAFRWAAGVARLLHHRRVPFVATLHGGALPEFMAAYPQRVEVVLRRAARVVAPSGYLQQAAERLGIATEVIPNGLELAQYTPVNDTPLSPSLVWVRAFHRIYQPTLAVEVLADLVGTHSDATLLMVGPDKDGTRGEVEARARALGVYDRVTFTGGQPKRDIPDLLRRGRVFLNTTTIDNMPVSVLEAAASGLCVVSTNVGGVPWLLRDGKEALLVPPGDAVAMATAVRQLLQDPALAMRLAGAARERALSYDWDTIVPRWDTLFREVVHEHRHGRVRA